MACPLRVEAQRIGSAILRVNDAPARCGGPLPVDIAEQRTLRTPTSETLDRRTRQWRSNACISYYDRRCLAAKPDCGHGDCCTGSRPQRLQYRSLRSDVMRTGRARSQRGSMRIMVRKIERRTPYEQTAQDLRDRVLREEFPPGSLLPSERDIAEEYGISRPTATKAVATLRTLGLVESEPGIGTRVVAPNSIITWTPRERYQTLQRGGRMRAEGEHSEFEVATEPVPGHVHTALDLAPGSEAIKRQRVVIVEDKGVRRPVELSTSWFDAAVEEECPALAISEPIPGGTTAYIEERLGRHAVSAIDLLFAESASVSDAKLLDINPDSALLVTHTTVFDDDGSPLTFEESKHPQPHRARYEYEF